LPGRHGKIGIEIIDHNGACLCLATVYQNGKIAELARRRANGICQLCDQPAPFANTKGEPYLESHHIIWLFQGGEDTVENTVALCPNCHKKMHILNRNSDKRKLIEEAKRSAAS